MNGLRQAQSPRPYNQRQALWAITSASFKAIFNQPTAVFFSLLFPIIFILIFGAFGNRGASYRVAMAAGSDTANEFYARLSKNPLIRLTKYNDTAQMNKDLAKGRITAVLLLRETKDSAGVSRFNIATHSTSASSNSFGGLIQILEFMKLKYEVDKAGNSTTLINMEKPVIESVKKYRQIDFVLPGQLGFSILFSTLFGVAFTFFNLRESLVLKRFYASPINRMNILLGIGISRLFFQLINVIVLILFGHLFLKFNLQHGVVTFLEMLVITIIMLFLLMGVGLIVSSIVKNDTTIPLWINLFGFPQMMLSGTFFPIEVFPGWLQSVCRILPLTQFNDAIRKISFEGSSIMECWKEIGILGIWIVIIYFITARVLKWE